MQARRRYKVVPHITAVDVGGSGTEFDSPLELSLGLAPAVEPARDWMLSLIRTCFLAQRAGASRMLLLPENAATKMTVRRYQQKAGPNGLELVEAVDMAAAEEFLAERARIA